MPIEIHQGHGYRNTRRTNIVKYPGEWILFLHRILTNSGLRNTVCICCCLLWQRLLQKAYWKKKLSFWLCCKIHFSSEIYYVVMKTNLWNLFLEVWLLFQMKRLKDNFANCNYFGILKVLNQLCLPNISHQKARKWYFLSIYPSLRPHYCLHLIKIKQSYDFFFFCPLKIYHFLLKLQPFYWQELWLKAKITIK